MNHPIRMLCTTLFLLVSLADLSIAAEDSGFVGDWMLTVDERGTGRLGQLELRRINSKMVGYVEGGPITLKISGKSIEMGVDDRTLGGDPFERDFRGTLKGDVIEGRYGPDEPPQICKEFPANCRNPSGTWKAKRISKKDYKKLPPSPVDLSGFWTPVPTAGGLGKYSMDLTPAAQELVDTFKIDMDMPALRCVSAGLVRSFSSAISTFEIINHGDRFTFISGPGEVRRILINDPGPSDFVLETPMGYSIGTWEGSTLVIETTLLLPSVRGFRGEPLSDNARVVERLTLSEDGNTLSSVMTTYDPDYYRKPPVKRRTWQRRQSVATSSPLSCDPDYFFRELYESGRMQEYIDRESRRF